jgi:UTP--glucose-1-phosphate uridylyltransferase
MQDRSPVKKVVIPVAGLGSRFLPATKALPKELLPIVDRPIIHYIVEEAIRAGLETVVFITSRPKILIEDYFDPGDLTTFRLKEAHKEKAIEDVLELSKKIDIVSIRQYEPHGLGHAILQAAPVVAGQSFAVVLGDDIILSNTQTTAIGQCIESFNSAGVGSVVGTLEVPREATRLYGIVAIDEAVAPAGGAAKITNFVEKPDPNEAPSNLAMPGRYVFEAPIIDFLRNTRPGKNGEIQLTDAMQTMLKAHHPYFARKIDGERFDTGDKLGYIIANVAVALRNHDFKEELRAWLSEKLKSMESR